MEQIQNLITGLKASLVELREREKIFIKSQTLQEQVEKARTAGDKLSDTLEAVKKTKSDAKQKRADILKSALDSLAKDITFLLPKGEAILSLDEKLFLGWKDGERLVPYQGLSGGEKVFFDGALASALLQGGGQKILIYEMAEMDQENMKTTLQIISNSHPDIQIIANSWVDPGDVPPPWRKVVLQ
jgi:hypothetical protein